MRIPEFMTAVQLIAHGGYETLVLNESVPTPRPGPEEVLIWVKAAGLNNTDINTRIGWYSATATAGTAETDGVGLSSEDGDWTGVGLAFPRVQGADVCGEIVAVCRPELSVVVRN